MDSESNPTNMQYQQVTVDVPEDRLAEFHALFARFLAGPIGRGWRARRGEAHRHGRGCARHHEAPGTEQTAEVTEV